MTYTTFMQAYSHREIDMKTNQDTTGVSGKFISRRLVLKLLSLAPLYWEQACAGLPGALPPSSGSRSILAAILDILIPRDTTPSASDLGLDLSIMSLAEQVPRYPELIEQGLLWFESTCVKSFNKSFTDLQSNTQNRIVEVAFSQPEMTLPRVCIERLRDDTMTLYYHNNVTWKETGIIRPIQPVGYPEHNEPPKEF